MSGFKLVGALALGAVLVLAPLGARAADFVLWWEKGFYPEEDQAIRQIVADFERKTGKTVELIQHSQSDMPEKVAAAVEAGATPDFVFASNDFFYATWARQDRLVELTDAIGPLVELFDDDLIAEATMYNARTNRRAIYSLPIGRGSNHVHIWTSLLKAAGFKLEDIPNDWEPFWAFWCDRVQPAVRKALGREDIWGTGLAMATDPTDTREQLEEFMAAYGTTWHPPENRFVPGDAELRTRLIRALDAYTAIYKKGCTPPQSVDWNSNLDNNKAFQTQRIVMTLNTTLSTTNALKETRPDDYYKNTWTIAWPRTLDGQPLPLYGPQFHAIVPKGGPHPEAALAFVRFLVRDMALADYLVAAHQRVLPPMQKLLDAPFWLDTSDPHFMRSAIQVLTQPKLERIVSNADAWRSRRVIEERVWPRAVHRVAAEGLTPEQAVDEALARMAEIWALPAPE